MNKAQKTAHVKALNRDFKAGRITPFVHWLGTTHPELGKGTAGGMLVTKRLMFAAWKAGQKSMLAQPQLINFNKAVAVEALHQRARWGTSHDSGKNPQDWFWLIGYLAGKALASALANDSGKALHHCISTAAVCLNWHAAISRSDNRMRPGIAPPEEKTPRSKLPNGVGAGYG